jgi:hypothetical protein
MRFVLALALLPVVACGGGEDASVSGVFPSSAFLGRKVRVEISGDVTSWKAGATVDFGAGVTVNSVSVASPTALFADITVAPDAAPGLRDVTVNSGGKFTLAQAFQLESAITLKVNGTLAQGSIATFAINNHDFNTPFDDTSTGDGFFTPIEYTNTSIQSPAGTQFSISSVTPYAITGTLFVDTNATAGKFVVDSGLEADAVTSELGEDLKIEARTATALTANTPAGGTVAKPFDSALYEFTPGAGPVLATLNATATGSASQPGLAILGSSGTFDDFLAYSNANNFVQMTPSKLYAIYFDNGGGAGYSFSVKANSQMLTAANEVEPNNTVGTANAASVMPFLLKTATLASATDVDWIKVTVSAANVGKKIHVITTGNDPQTDTVLQVFQANGTTAFGAASSDSNYHEDLVTAAVTTAGDYMVKVTASEYFTATHNTYMAAVWFE